MQRRQLSLDRLLLADQPGRRRSEGLVEGFAIRLGRAECRQQLLDHRAAEARLEQLLDLDDESQVLR
ncbi:hypothetical protein ASF96_06755 [Microbacterium sp. Leaf179]|nr:hypothetical protein ASF96_06755 [Microbacterium sp. Leaf179]